MLQQALEEIHGWITEVLGGDWLFIHDHRWQTSLSSDLYQNYFWFTYTWLNNKQEKGGMQGAASVMLVLSAEGMSASCSLYHNVQPAPAHRGPPSHDFL